MGGGGWSNYVGLLLLAVMTLEEVALVSGVCVCVCVWLGELVRGKEWNGMEVEGEGRDVGGGQYYLLKLYINVSSAIR